MKSDSARTKSYVCYVLSNRSKMRTYAGCTNHFSKRIRQHNGEISGGARSTKSGGPWEPMFVVEGFGADKVAALRFEWRLKRHRRQGWGRGLRGPPARCREVLLSRALAWASDHLPGLELSVKRYQHCGAKNGA